NNLRSRLEAGLREVKLQWQLDPEERLRQLEEMHQQCEWKLRQYKEQLHLDLENISEEKLQLRQRLEISRRAQFASIQLAQLSSEITRLRKENHSIELQAEKLPQEREKLLLQVESSQRKLEGLQLKKENQLLVASNEELRRKLENGK